MKPSYQRLESLDVLRGFDLFCLVALEASRTCDRCALV